MGRAEGVVNVDVAQIGHLFGQFEIILLFPAVEASIFEHQHVGGLEALGHHLDLVSDAIRGLY
jgi:hypothetical protein